MSYFNYKVTEFDEDGREVDQYTGDSTEDWNMVGVDDSSAADVARAIADQWAPEFPTATAWRVRVELGDGEKAEAWDPASHASRAPKPLPPEPKVLAARADPPAQRLRTIAEPVAGDDTLRAVLRLLPVAADIAVLTGYVLNTTGDPAGTGRHNLQALRDLGRRLASLADAALLDEPGGPPRG